LLHLSNFRFFRNKAKQNSSLFFRFFHFFFAIFSIFSQFFAFDLVIFASKRNKAKQKSSIIFRFFAFFHFFFAFFHFFSLNFRFASIFSLNFCLFYLRFCFRFLVFRIEVNHVKSSFFFASKRNEIFATISNFASEAKVRAHPNSVCPFVRTRNWVHPPVNCKRVLLPTPPLWAKGRRHTRLRRGGGGDPIPTKGQTPASLALAFSFV
jgi:hypothetical protein